MLLGFWLAAVIGTAIARALGGLTQLLFLIGMPVLMVMTGLQLVT